MFIPRKRLLPQGPEFSEIIYGTVKLLDDPKGYYYGRILEKLNVCLENGITTFEIPQHTQQKSSEVVIGNVLRQEKTLRDKIQVISTCILPFLQSNDFSDKNLLIESVENSLENLSLEKIDLLLLEISSFCCNIYEIAEAVHQLIREGKILQVGISNPTYSKIFMFQSCLNFPLATCQFPFNPIRKEALDQGVFDACMQLRIKPLISYPCEFGYLFSSETPELQKLKSILTEIAREKHASLEEIILSWLTEHPSSPFVVIGTNRGDRISLLRDYKNLKLSKEEWLRIGLLR